MPFKIAKSLLVWLWLLNGWSSAQAQGNIAGAALELPGVSGEYPGYIPPDNTNTNYYAGKIESSTFSWQVVWSVGTNGGPGTRTFSNVGFTKPLDKATPTLARSCVVGTVYSPATVHILGFNGLTPELETIIFSNAIVSSVNDGVRGGLFGSSQEMVAFNFSGMKVSTSFSPTVQPRWFALYLPGVPGPFSDTVHTNWIGLTSLSLGVGNSGTITPGSSAPSFQDIYATKFADTASSGLISNCLAGTVFSNAVVDAYFTGVSGVRIWYHLKMEKVWISNMGQSFSQGGDLNEFLGLHFSGKITWSYTQAPASATQPDTFASFWDLQQGAGANGTPFATVTGIQQAGGNSVAITWPAVDGGSYNILGAAQVTGPYQYVAGYTATNTGPVTVSVPISGNQRFFQVQLPSGL
ncbi:MAG: Type secretion system effector, Hcp1 family [Pedosphaera sp.]|nr:Type secretion system effector, Hcp1 family [Pedosphaera sp.]